MGDLYIKIGRFVRLPGSVSECRTVGMTVMSQCQPYATMQHRGHAAVFGRRHLARSALRPSPTACMRECLHRCVRWEDEEVAGRLQRAAMSYSLSTLREKGEEEKGRGGRRREWCVRYVPFYRTPELLKISMLGELRAVTVSLTFGNSNYGNTPVAAAFRPTKLRAWPSVCVMLHDNLLSPVHSSNMSKQQATCSIRHVERNFINIHNTSRDKAYSIHIIHVIRLDDARSDVSQNMDADDELKLSLSAVVIATKRRQVRSCWVRPWICSRPYFGGYDWGTTDECSTCRQSRPHQLLRQLLVARSFDMSKEIEHVQFVSTCRKDEKIVRHVAKNGNMSNGNIRHVASTCRIRHVGSTCCWCGRGFRPHTRVNADWLPASWTVRPARSVSVLNTLPTLQLRITLLQCVKLPQIHHCSLNPAFLLLAYAACFRHVHGTRWRKTAAYGGAENERLENERTDWLWKADTLPYVNLRGMTDCRWF